ASVWSHSLTRVQVDLLIILTYKATAKMMRYFLQLAEAIVEFFITHLILFFLFAYKLVSEHSFCSILVKMALNMQGQITIAAWAITYANDREAARRTRHVFLLSQRSILRFIKMLCQIEDEEVTLTDIFGEERV
ncbi:hypothetical protein L9F63_010014, partial [Diploptera punctata]